MVKWCNVITDNEYESSTGHHHVGPLSLGYHAAGEKSDQSCETFQEGRGHQPFFLLFLITVWVRYLESDYTGPGCFTLFLSLTELLLVQSIPGIDDNVRPALSLLGQAALQLRLTGKFSQRRRLQPALSQSFPLQPGLAHQQSGHYNTRVHLVTRSLTKLKLQVSYDLYQ